MAYNPATRRKPMSQINVVPYIDVMLVLLVIFMVTAPMLQQGVEIDLPNAPSKELSEETLDKQLVVIIDDQGAFYLQLEGSDEQAIGEQDLQQQAAEYMVANPRAKVFVKGDQGVEYGRVVLAMVLLKNAGADSVGLVTEPPSDREN